VRVEVGDGAIECVERFAEIGERGVEALLDVVGSSWVVEAAVEGNGMEIGTAEAQGRRGHSELGAPAAECLGDGGQGVAEEDEAGRRAVNEGAKADLALRCDRVGFVEDDDGRVARDEGFEARVEGVEAPVFGGVEADGGRCLEGGDGSGGEGGFADAWRACDDCVWEDVASLNANKEGLHERVGGEDGVNGLGAELLGEGGGEAFA